MKRTRERRNRRWSSRRWLASSPEVLVGAAVWNSPKLGKMTLSHHMPYPWREEEGCLGSSFLFEGGNPKDGDIRDLG